jgi:hypothetical protein
VAARRYEVPASVVAGLGAALDLALDAYSDATAAAEDQDAGTAR